MRFGHWTSNAYLRMRWRFTDPSTSPPLTNGGSTLWWSIYWSTVVGSTTRLEEGSLHSTWKLCSAAYYLKFSTTSFFHHLTECAATTIEIASASFGQPKPIFNDYWNCRFQGTDGIGAHPDHPLEEALANAYAYNSFSFLARTQIGYKVLWVKVYQKIIQKCWFQEPIGYRSAWRYINGEYVSGAAQLLAMILCSPDVDPASLMLLAKTVMPNGNSAFLQKPDIPTYLVGSDDALTEFSRLVPAPNETYTSLLWLGDTSSVDQYLQNRRKQENEARKKR